MSYLALLRALVDQQQFFELEANAFAYWQETGDPAALPLQALALAHLGERREAHRLLATALPLEDRLDADARCDLAACCIVLARPHEARALLSGVLAERPDHPLALARLAWCCMNDGDGHEARRLYGRAARLAPWRIPVHLGLARLCLDESDVAAAQAAIDAAMRCLDAPDASRLRPDTSLENPRRQGRPDAMPAGAHRSTAHPAASRNPFEGQLQLLQLEAWNASGATSQAEAWLEGCRTALPEVEWVTLLLGQARLLAAADRHAEAEEALRQGLAHAPDNVAIHQQLAELAQLLGRAVQAAQLLRKAIRLAQHAGDDCIGLWVRLSSVCLHHDGRRARRAAEKALALATAPTQVDDHGAAHLARRCADAKHALAQVESHDDHFEAAEALYRELLDENPYFLPALQGLGQQQMRRGRLDEAIALFERMKAVNPAKGHAALITARRFPDDVATLDRMEKLARQPSMEGASRASLLLQLAAAWEKRRDFDKAFTLATQANAAARRVLRYDPKAHRQSCARIRAAFCRELYAHRSDCGVDSRLPVYVVGMPRSGTTLVEQIIAGHSHVFGAGELGLIPGVVQGLERWERHIGSGRRYPDCVDDLSPHVTAGIAAGVLADLTDFCPGAKRVVDKLPHNFQHIGLIKFLFPNAQIVSVRRDPRDIAISNFFTDYQARHGGMGFAYDLADIGEQLADHNLLMDHWHRLFPGQILELQYEQVVDDTEAAARRLLEHLGLEWEPQVLDFDALDRPVKTASVWQVRQPIYASSKARWANYRDHIGPLIRATNARIEPEPITDMVTLPEPGWLGTGMAFYRDDELDAAERCFRKLLHHLPGHGAANFMTGLIALRKGHPGTAIALMEQALAACPWNKAWRADAIRACELAGETARAEALRRDAPRRRTRPARERMAQGAARAEPAVA